MIIIDLIVCLYKNEQKIFFEGLVCLVVGAHALQPDEDGRGPGAAQTLRTVEGQVLKGIHRPLILNKICAFRFIPLFSIGLKML